MHLVHAILHLDQRHVFWDESMLPVKRYVYGPDDDVAIEKVEVKDLLLTVLSYDNFRPYNVSILTAKAPILRQRWLLYDMLSAESMVGVFDTSLFSLHTPQIEMHQNDATDTSHAYNCLVRLRLVCVCNL